MAKTELTETFGDEVAEVTHESSVIALRQAAESMPFLDSENVAMEIAMRTLKATDADTVDAATGAQSVTQLGLVGRHLTILGFALAESEFQEGVNPCPFYARVEATAPGGEILAFSIGGWAPISQLMAWQKLGAFPRREMIVEIPSKVAGRSPAYRFVKAPN